jgi:hypothetical protein
MGSSHSTRRRPGNQLSSADFVHSVNSKDGGDTSVCNGKSLVGFRVSKRSKVYRSNSEKSAAVTGARAVINRVASINGWTTAAHRRTVSVTGEIIDECVCEGGEKSAVCSVPLLESTVAGPYQPCGVDGWKMIDEDNANLSNSEVLASEKLLESDNASDSRKVMCALETFSVQANTLTATTCATVSLLNPGCATPVSSVISRQDSDQNVGNFLSKTRLTDVAKTVHEDDLCSYEAQTSTSDISCSGVQPKSLKLYGVMKTGNIDEHHEETLVDEVCSCKLSYRPHAKLDELNSEIKKPLDLKESSVNSAVSQDSGHASSVGVIASCQLVSAVNGIDDLFSSMCSLASDDLMLETEAELASTPGYDSHRSSFDAGRISHGHYARTSSNIMVAKQPHNLMSSNVIRSNRQSCGYGDWQKIMATKDGVQKQASFNLLGIAPESGPVVASSTLSQLHPVDSGLVQNMHCFVTFMFIVHILCLLVKVCSCSAVSLMTEF